MRICQSISDWRNNDDFIVNPFPLPFEQGENDIEAMNARHMRRLSAILTNHLEVSLVLGRAWADYHRSAASLMHRL